MWLVGKSKVCRGKSVAKSNGKFNAFQKQIIYINQNNTKKEKNKSNTNQTASENVLKTQLYTNLSEIPNSK